MNSRVRRWSPLPLVVLVCTCKPEREPTAPCNDPIRLQVLAGSTTPVNVADGEQSWPVHVTLYQFSAAPSLVDLDAATVYDQREAAFKEHYVDKLEFTVYPDARVTPALELKPEVTDIVAVAHFLRPSGEGWYVPYRTPRAYAQQVCEARTRGQELAPPCLFLHITRAELSGGSAEPPGLDVAAFKTTCAVRPREGSPR